MQHVTSCFRRVSLIKDTLAIFPRTIFGSCNYNIFLSFHCFINKFLLFDTFSQNSRNKIYEIQFKIFKCLMKFLERFADWLIEIIFETGSKKSTKFISLFRFLSRKWKINPRLILKSTPNWSFLRHDFWVFEKSCQ